METTTYYIIIAAIMLCLEALYIPLGKKLGIGADVNHRSSHKARTLTCGGYIFYVSALLCAFLYPSPANYSIVKMLVCGGILFLISLADDIKEVSPVTRLICHTAVAAVIFFPVAQEGHFDIFLILMICSVGCINGFNFMDGINGMMGLYSVVTLSSIYYLYSSSPHTPLLSLYMPYIATLIIASIVFCFFNFRKKALFFSGDVGSIVLGFFIAVFITHYIITTAEASSIVILIVYAVDTSLTIIQRLFMGANILTPHRLHLYQALTNKKGLQHRTVSLYYATAQLLINIGYFLTSKDYKWTYTIIITMIVASVYFILKRNISPKNKISQDKQ